MITFTGGPAHGQTLMLHRAPRFLRVTKQGAKFDALDAPVDVALPDEALFAYEIVGKPSMCHLKMSGKGSGFYALASYRYLERQPSDRTMRSNVRWQEWCEKGTDEAEPDPMQSPLWSTSAPHEVSLESPIVLNIRDTKEGTYIGREMPKQGLAGSEWANTEKLEADTPDARFAAIRRFVVRLLDDDIRSRLGSLAGQRLLCWCSPKLCHGDALAELVQATKFYGAKCPHCQGPVASFLNWHERLQVLAEAWVCQSKTCGRRGEGRRRIPRCLQSASEPLLL